MKIKFDSELYAMTCAFLKERVAFYKDFKNTTGISLFEILGIVIIAVALVAIDTFVLPIEILLSIKLCK